MLRFTYSEEGRPIISSREEEYQCHTRHPGIADINRKRLSATYLFTFSDYIYNTFSPYS